MGDTLINEFSPDEIETLLEHELGQHVHHDIPVLVTFEILSTTLELYLASLGLHWAIGAFGFTRLANQNPVKLIPKIGWCLCFTRIHLWGKES